MKAISDNGFWVRYNKSDSSLIDYDNDHVFCGLNNIKGAICPNCTKPLLLMITINSKDEKLDIDIGIKLIRLFFCWTCNIAQYPFYYQIISDDEIVLLEYGKNGCEYDFPYNDYPTSFPVRKAILTPINQDDQKLIKDINDGTISEFDVMKYKPQLCTPHHQIGGEPYLLDPSGDKIMCILCKNEMAYISVIADDCADDRGFVGQEYVQTLFFVCDKCQVICAIQRCD